MVYFFILCSIINSVNSCIGASDLYKLRDDIDPNVTINRHFVVTRLKMFENGCIVEYFKEGKF